MRIEIKFQAYKDMVNEMERNYMSLEHVNDFYI